MTVSRCFPAPAASIVIPAPAGIQRDEFPVLSGYRLMWMLVMFDLPVQTKPERRAAAKFRMFLLDQGFQMCQLSVYLRFCAGKDQTQVYTRRVQRRLPAAGNVQILYFTDKQYENIVSFDGPRRRRANQNPEQFTLF